MFKRTLTFVIGGAVAFAAHAAWAEMPASLEAPPQPAPLFPAVLALPSLTSEFTTLNADGSAVFLGRKQLEDLPNMAPDPLGAALQRARHYFARSMLSGPGRLELATAGAEQEEGEVRAYLYQTFKGVRVEGTYAVAALQDRYLKFARHFLVKPSPIAVTPAIKPAQAETTALEEMLRLVEHATLREEAKAELVIIFHEEQPKLVWRVEIATEKPWELRAAYVDARTGEYLTYAKLSHDAVQGHVRFNVEPNCVGDRPVMVSMPYVRWSPSEFADSRGAFRSARAMQSTRVTLESPFVRLSNERGRVAGPWLYNLAPSPADNDVDIGNAPLDQVNPFYHIHRVRAWLRSRLQAENSQSRWTDTQITVRVNIPDSCNAYYYASTLNFFSAGSGCMNTGRSAGIVYHEYGHGIHDHSTPIPGQRMDSQVSEGIADYVAATITDNPVMRGIFSCNDNFRSCVNSLTYCNRGCDITPASEVHQAGQVICAVWWEIRQQLIARYGKVRGVATADRIYLKFLTFVGNMFTTYQAAIAADDDIDNDPSNGTTHSCEINKAFANDDPNEPAHFPTLRNLVPCRPSNP